MEKKQDGRRDIVMTDVEDLVPKDHLLRKIENFSRFGRILLLFFHYCPICIVLL